MLKVKQNKKNITHKLSMQCVFLMTEPVDPIKCSTISVAMVLLVCNKKIILPFNSTSAK